MQLRLHAVACCNSVGAIHAAKPPIPEQFAKGSHRDEYNSAAVPAFSGRLKSVFTGLAIICVRMLHRLQIRVCMNQGARLTKHSTALTPG